MKQTFNSKILDWIFIITSFLFFVDTLMKLYRDYETLYNYPNKIILVVVSLLTLVSYFFRQLNTSVFSIIFIIVLFFLPLILVIRRYLFDLLFYGINRFNLLFKPIVLIKLFLGVVFFVLIIKFSKKVEKQE